MLNNNSGARRLILIFVTTMLSLVALDAGLGYFLNRNSSAAEPGRLTRYFDYGRSIVGKLTLRVTPECKGGDAVIRAGWLDVAKWQSLAGSDGQSGMVVAGYGQSFTFNALKSAARDRPGWRLRLIGGPAAPISHSLAAYRLDRARRADVVVLGVLASAISSTSRGSMLAATFENPAPFAFPVYSSVDGRLIETPPAFLTCVEFADAFLRRDGRWGRFIQATRSNNPEVDDFVLGWDWVDSSLIARLIRRGWVAASVNSDPRSSEDGLPMSFHRQIPVAQAILDEFVMEARRRNEPLIVLLIHDRGYDRALDGAIGSRLRMAGVPVVSTSPLFSSRSVGNFIADGHFSDPANEQLGAAVRTAIDDVR